MAVMKQESGVLVYFDFGFLIADFGFLGNKISFQESN
jgi:hypothetical protein